MGYMNGVLFFSTLQYSITPVLHGREFREILATLRSSYYGLEFRYFARVEGFHLIHFHAKLLVTACRASCIQQQHDGIILVCCCIIGVFIPAGSQQAVFLLPQFGFKLRFKIALPFF